MPVHVKKRGKANAQIVIESALPTMTDIVVSPEKLPSNLILHLKKIAKLDYENNDFTDTTVLSYNPDISTPSAYDPVDVSSFSYVINEKMDTENESENKEAIQSYCWWCCHTYNNKCLRIPINKHADKPYECVGQFCSPECTCAYIMDSGSRYGDMWRQYELLHEMLNINKRIQPAPKRELLNVFGGPLTISEFRGSTKWNLVYPPMVSLKMQMDDTPVEKNDEENLLFTNTSKLNVGNINLETIDELIPEKKKTKKSKTTVKTTGSLDRFWGSD
jgi:hypothetical protein